MLENREVTRIGDTAPRGVDVRVVTATHRDLGARAAEHQFREDLLYRINVGRINLPPLRERREDIPYLVHNFLVKGNRMVDKPTPVCGEQAMAALTAYDWPGNVRELRNVVELAMIRCKGNRIETRDLSPEVLGGKTVAAGVKTAVPSGRPVRETLDARVLRSYKEHGGDVQATATALGLTVPSLYRKCPRVFEQALAMAMKQTGGRIAEAAELMGLSRATLYRKIHAGD